jgi:hypothetical protein
VTKTCGRCEAVPARVKVRGGKASGTPKGYADVDTVPELFAYAQKAIKSHPYTLTVTFNARTGVPQTLVVDERKDLVDDVTGLVVTGFRKT